MVSLSSIAGRSVPAYERSRGSGGQAGRGLVGDPEDVGTQRDESGDADYADYADYAADGPLGLCTRYQLRAPLAARPQCAAAGERSPEAGWLAEDRGWGVATRWMIRTMLWSDAGAGRPAGRDRSARSCAGPAPSGLVRCRIRGRNR